MGYIMAFVACAALLQMLGYVDSAILAVDYSLTEIFIISIVATVILFVITAILPKPEPQEHHHH